MVPTGTCIEMVIREIIVYSCYWLMHTLVWGEPSIILRGENGNFRQNLLQDFHLIIYYSKVGRNMRNKKCYLLTI